MDSNSAQDTAASLAPLLQYFFSDKKHLKNCLIIRYENFVRDPENHLKKTCDFVGIEVHAPSIEIRKEVNEQYFEKWQRIMVEWKISNNKIMKTELAKIEKEVHK